jgi:hypothetical protein
MDRTELIKLLMIYRMSRAGMAQGLSQEVATEMAEDTVRQQVTDPSIAISGPDGSIVVIVECYLAKVGPVVGGVFDVENPPATDDFNAANSEAIREIENHRNMMWQGEATPPQRFADYVYYRTRLETTKQLGISPEEMGLDSQTVTNMVKLTIAILGQKYAPKQANKSSSECFVATACFGSPDEPVVAALRVFRDQTLSTSLWGRAFIRWYYKNGPQMASWVRSNPNMRRAIRVALRLTVRVISVRNVFC